MTIHAEVNALAGIPRRHFATIMADPPWHFRARTALSEGHWKSRRDAEKHYPVMGLDEIKALPVRDIAAADAHLWLWTTGPCLPQALEVIQAWGFRYSGMGFVWAKLSRGFATGPSRTINLESAFHFGLGMTTRKNAEFCILARRGNAKRVAKNVRELIVAPVREHSRKPTQAYERAEAYAVGPYLELFGRETRPGWTVWGNESGKFDQAAE